MRIIIAAFLIMCMALTSACSFIRPKGSVRFAYQGQAESVCVAGDFNDWSGTENCMERTDGAWSSWIVLGPGRHSYLFVIDGEKWVPDPESQYHEDDGFGQTNSVVVVFR